MTDTLDAARNEAHSSGTLIEVPLNKLKKSPRNARKTPHSEASIEALAASISAKGMFHPLTVEPELDGSGHATGCYLVTIGEGRRLAHVLRAKRKEIGKAHPIRCVVDVEHDPYEISLDENVTRSDMHPADQFEAFKRLIAEHGFSPEDIATRFGVSLWTVRQRLRLGMVSPKLLELYRSAELTLDQLMAFAVSEDHARQEQVYEALSWNRQPHLIRRMMTEALVAAADRRAVFVGVQTYVDAGGKILRDLFTEDGGGWLEDVALLDRFALEGLERVALDIKAREGWAWAEAAIEAPAGTKMRRTYPHPVERSAAEVTEGERLEAEFEALATLWEGADEAPAEVEVQLSDLQGRLQRFADGGYDYDAADRERAGVIVWLDHAGEARIERGFVRPEDELPVEDSDARSSEEGPEAEQDRRRPSSSALSAALALNLTAHRTMGMRDALAEQPQVALFALLHALVLRTFYAGHSYPSCLTLQAHSTFLCAHAPEAAEQPAGCRMVERRETWTRRLPQSPEDVWDALAGFTTDERLSLLAYCVGETVDAVSDHEASQPAQNPANVLAAAVALDMRKTWTPTAAGYFERVSKPHILAAVREAVSAEAAWRLEGLKKPAMAAEAARLLADTPWLPPILRMRIDEAAS